jgi:hypothetical protein
MTIKWTSEIDLRGKSSQQEVNCNYLAMNILSQLLSSLIKSSFRAPRIFDIAVALFHLLKLWMFSLSNHSLRGEKTNKQVPIIP